MSTTERIEQIRKINATKTFGHGESAVSHCAFLLKQVDELQAQLKEAQRKLENCHNRQSLLEANIKGAMTR